MARAARKIPEGSWPRLMSAERAAAYCDCSVPTFMTAIGSRFAPVMIASRKHWDRLVIDKWIDEHGAVDQPEWMKGFDR